MYRARGGEGFVVRPDGCPGPRAAPVSGPDVTACLDALFLP